MKTLDDLGLCKKSRKKIENWLQEWLDLFIKQANGKQGWVYRANFENNDFFYFTDCKDILEKDPEARAQENNLTIRSRKRKILLQLFIKTLMGKNLGTTITCDHCGFSPCWINGLPDGTGHWVYCPKCKKTDIHVFPEGYDNCMNTIKQEITKKKDKIQLLANPYYNKLAEEIKAHKYNKFEKDLSEVSKIVTKRKVPKGAWSTTIKGNKEKKKE